MAKVDVPVAVIAPQFMVPVTVKTLPSNVNFDSTVASSESLKVHIPFSVLPSNEIPAPPASHIALFPSHFKNSPLSGLSWPILVTCPLPSNVNAVVPPASFKDPPSSNIISSETFKEPVIATVLLKSVS